MKWQATIMKGKVVEGLLLRPGFMYEMMVLIPFALFLGFMMPGITEGVYVFYAPLFIQYLVILVVFVIGLEAVIGLIFYNQLKRANKKCLVEYTIDQDMLHTDFGWQKVTAPLSMLQVVRVLDRLVVTKRRGAWLRAEGFMYFDNNADRDKALTVINKGLNQKGQEQ